MSGTLSDANYCSIFVPGAQSVQLEGVQELAEPFQKLAEKLGVLDRADTRFIPCRMVPDDQRLWKVIDRGEHVADGLAAWIGGDFLQPLHGRLRLCGRKIVDSQMEEGRTERYGPFHGDRDTLFKHRQQDPRLD